MNEVSDITTQYDQVSRGIFALSAERDPEEATRTSRHIGWLASSRWFYIPIRGASGQIDKILDFKMKESIPETHPWWRWNTCVVMDVSNTNLVEWRTQWHIPVWLLEIRAFLERCSSGLVD